MKLKKAKRECDTIAADLGPFSTPEVEMNIPTKQPFFYSRMRSEGSRFTWGSGGEAVFAKFCVCVRNRRQPFATVCGDAVRLSTVASASGVVRKACQVDSLSPQLFWCLQRMCLRDWSVSPQLFWCLQRRCQWERSVSPQLHWCSQRRCQCEWSVAPDVSAPQECQVRVSYKSVKKERPTRVSYKSVKSECRRRSVKQECLTRVSSKSVLQECQVRVSYKSVK